MFFWYPAVAVDFMEISQSQSSMQSGDNGQPKSLLSLKKLSGPNNLQVNNHLRLESSTCFNTCQNLLTVNALFLQDVLMKISQKKERALTLPCAILHHPHLFTTFDFRQQLVCVDSTSTIMVHIPPLLHLHSSD